MDVIGFYSNLPTIETDRVILRKMTTADAKDIYAYASDPEVSKYMVWEPHDSVDVSMSFVELNLKFYSGGKPGSWAIENKNDHRMMGTFAYSKVEPRHLFAVVGYVLGRPYWNQGIMTEIMKKMLRFGFENLGMNRIEATCDTQNVGSWRVMEKAGMLLEGVRRQDVFLKGHFRDSRLYSILRSEWQGPDPK